MDTPTRETRFLNRAVASEIRAVLARRGMKQAQLAQLLGQPELWLSRRLRAQVPMSVDDLDAMCRVLKLEPADLITTAIREAADTRTTYRGRPSRPTDTRPNGRPSTDRRTSTSVRPEQRRPVRISRPAAA